MKLKAILGLIAMALAIAFFLPPVIKLKKVALTVVVLIGVGMMVYEYIETLREPDED